MVSLSHKPVIALLLLLLGPAACVPGRAADARLWANGAAKRAGASDAIWRQAVYRAIEDSLSQKGVSERAELRPEDLVIQLSAPARQDDVGLKVRKIRFDPLRRETVIELWASHEPQFLAFDVTTRQDPRCLGVGRADESAQSGISRRAGNAAFLSPVVLAKPGRAVTLLILAPDIRITITVMPLQPGTRGQRILVRDPVTQRVMSAVVVDDGVLQCSL